MIVRLWWICHWCGWEASERFRPFDRWWATREFVRHLREAHPDVDYHPKYRRRYPL